MVIRKEWSLQNACYMENLLRRREIILQFSRSRKGLTPSPHFHIHPTTCSSQPGWLSSESHPSKEKDADAFCGMGELNWPQAATGPHSWVKEDEPFGSAGPFKQLARCMKPQLQSTETQTLINFSLFPLVLGDQCPYTQNVSLPKAGLERVAGSLPGEHQAPPRGKQINPVQTSFIFCQLKLFGKCILIFYGKN